MTPSLEITDDAAPLYVSLPLAGDVGWGICGRNLARELSRLTPLRLASLEVNPDVLGPLDRDALMPLRPTSRELEALRGEVEMRVAAPVLHAVGGLDMNPARAHLRGTRQVGYTFFESPALPPASVERARRHFDVIAAGSTWCADILRAHGLPAEAVPQGIDPTVFEPSALPREYFRDRFTIFSGGKFELRKGQDLVIRAFAALSQKYDDVLLVASWFNLWRSSVATMEASPYIRFRMSDDEPFLELMQRTLVDNGIDPARVVILEPMPHDRLARVYKNTDVGLFTNRCEGGTNLVLMEYMACGRPAIAAFNSGHRDLVTPANAIPVWNHGKMVYDDGCQAVEWDDPSLDEIVAHLEWAYLHRNRLPRLARRAGADLRAWTWSKTARDLYRLLLPSASRMSSTTPLHTPGAG